MGGLRGVRAEKGVLSRIERVRVKRGWVGGRPHPSVLGRPWHCPQAAQGSAPPQPAYVRWREALLRTRTTEGARDGSHSGSRGADQEDQEQEQEEQRPPSGAAMRPLLLGPLADLTVCYLLS